MKDASLIDESGLVLKSAELGGLLRDIAYVRAALGFGAGVGGASAGAKGKSLGGDSTPSTRRVLSIEERRRAIATADPLGALRRNRLCCVLCCIVVFLYCNTCTVYCFQMCSAATVR